MVCMGVASANQRVQWVCMQYVTKGSPGLTVYDHLVASLSQLRHHYML